MSYRTWTPAQPPNNFNGYSDRERGTSHFFLSFGQSQTALEAAGKSLFAASVQLAGSDLLGAAQFPQCSGQMDKSSGKEQGQEPDV